IEVICGSMFSGKTEELIRRIKRAKIANQKFKVFKPTIDSRSKNYIESHDESKLESTEVKHSSEILDNVKNCHVVAIDEAQFFDDGIVNVCNQLANSGIRVIIAGLDMDYLGNPFGPIPNLMAVAEYVTKVHAVCKKSGNIANYSFRKNKKKDIVVIGEKDKYEPLSRSIYYKKMKIDKKK
ncbi:thymidine kinase, partial [Flavobacteriaceae bacterium]|nr:thymidine kinase [Flavobacteriaceae bacterium]